ncbi:MAG: hypothetical protein KGO85_02925 [Proteobacteria bacterium]|nr:hypothetical protein [Pseudomonadota bacterium]
MSLCCCPSKKRINSRKGSVPSLSCNKAWCWCNKAWCSCNKAWCSCSSPLLSVSGTFASKKIALAIDVFLL